MSDFDPSAYGAGIADAYDAIYDGFFETDAAVERLAELADGGPVLELGIGTGRLALPLVERGLEVHGIDGSPEMVELLHAKPGGAAIPAVVGNFADARAERADFSLVVLAVNTIYALPDQAAQVACFANAARHLRSGGRYVVEAWVPDVGAFRRHRLVRPRIVRGDEISIEVAEHDPVHQLIRASQAFLRSGSVVVHPTTHRYAWPAELDLMAQLAGMALEDRWGDWRGGAFTADSTDHVSVYVKR